MCVPGQEAALLVRAAVDGEVEEVASRCRSSSAACCPSPARRSRRSVAPWRLSSIRKARSSRLTSGARARRRPGRASRRRVAGRLARARAARDARARSGTRVAGVARVDAQRAAVRRQLLDVEHRRPCGGEDALRREQREVREVLVVDRVELVVLDEPQQVRELHRDRRRRRRAAICMPRDEVVEVGHVASTLLPSSRSALAAPPRAPRAVVAAEERDDRRDAPLDAPPRRRSRPARRRAPARPRSREVLQQVAVVARDLDDRGCRARGRSARPPSRRSDARARASSSSTTRSTRSRRRSRSARLELLELHEEAVARRPARAADRTAPSRRAASGGQVASSPAATCRGRRTRRAAARRRSGTGSREARGENSCRLGGRRVPRDEA